MASNTQRAQAVLWSTENGRLRTGLLVLLFALFGVTLGFFDNLIWWLRSGTPITVSGLRYGLLFGAYHMVIAMVVRLALWRRADSAWSGWTVPLLLGACLALFTVLRWIGDQYLLPLLGGTTNYPPEVGFFSIALDNLSYGLLPIGSGALVHAVEAQFAALRRQLVLAHQQRLSELDMLRARIAPHFLFNTLNNLYALAQRPGADLSTPIHDLSELMRYVAKNDQPLVPVAEEHEHVMRYVDLQRLRYAKPLNLEIDVPAGVQQALLPPMVLLPLVENAFKHGDPCHAHIPLLLQLEQRNGRLLIHCSNAVSTGAADGGNPTGNRDLKRRLHLLYDGCAQVHFAQTDDCFTADLSIPLETRT